jgi:multidrug efflux pump subunit AcrB
MTLLTIGQDNARTQNVGRIYVKLVDPERRKITQNELMNRARHEIMEKQDKSLRLAVQEVAAFGNGAFSTAKIQYAIRGPDLKKLEAATAHILPKLQKVPGAVDVDSTLITGKPEIGVYIDRPRAADLGVSVADTAVALRLLVDGENVSDFEEKGEQYEVRVRAEKEYRADAIGLAMLTVPSQRLGLVPLRSVVDLKRGTGPATISHLNRQRLVMLLANVAPGVSEAKIADAMANAIREENLPPDYVYEAVGQTREMQRVFTSFILAVVLSFIVMYLVLAAQFESWLHPITILLSLPLTLPFAFLSIILFRQAIDLYSVLGILVLFGVVKKNSILQIDHTNQLRAKGLGRDEAILQANKDRLRPILMTTAAFVAGMLPLVTSQGVGSAFNRATSGVVVGGQTLSLLLTLVATPVAYSYFDDISAFFRRHFGGKREPEPASVRDVDEVSAHAEE